MVGLLYTVVRPLCVFSSQPILKNMYDWYKIKLTSIKLTSNRILVVYYYIILRYRI
jgi:hypothetical protein